MIPEINKIFSGKLKRSKRGSLSLSINAIVILVLAIAMLGLGLAFTKTMFKKFGEKLTIPPPDIPATPEDPIIFPGEQIEFKHGDSAVFQVNFYNDFNDATVRPVFTCSDTFRSVIGTDNSNIENYVVAAPQSVRGGEYKPFKFIIPADATGTTETNKQDVCTVEFCIDDGAGACLFEGFREQRQIILRVT